MIKVMEDKTYMVPPFGGKSILRNTGEEVEIIDAMIKERGARSEEDWVTYIDSAGKEHIQERLNAQIDFKPVINDTWNSMFDWAKNNKMPSTRNCRTFEMAKELVKGGWSIADAVNTAKQLVDEVGIETE